jgi:hypothetical protein
MGHISVRLTDAPLAGVASATVWVSQVYLVPGRFVISSTPVSYDLLDLQSGVTASLGAADIPVGDYEQLRLVVDSAVLTLADGSTFSDGSNTKTLKVPSGMQTGIKVNFGGPIHVAPGETDLVVDFDVSRNFVFTGVASHPDGVLFKPVLHGSVQDVAGSISGTSLPASAKGKLFAILGTDTVTTALADTVSGAYALLFLPPGSYTVADSAPGFKTQTQTVTVGAAEHVTGVDFTLSP